MTTPENAATAEQARLFAVLDDLGIGYAVAPYPIHETVEEGKQRRGDLPGVFTKNLLLKDKKKRLYLLTVHEDREVVLKGLHRAIGASGQLGFASPDAMQTYLGVAPGALTPMGVINDSGNAVTVVIDQALLGADLVNFHPLTQPETIRLAPGDFRRFLAGQGTPEVVVDLEAAGT